jgi:CHAT domain-containing protein/Tfp pilus assembly protein PilF
MRPDRASGLRARPPDEGAPGAATARYRDLPAEEAAEQRTVPCGRSVIAAIGIDRYTHWPMLSNAVSDARATIALFEKLGFELFAEPLLDGAATAGAMRQLVVDDLGRLRHDDSLVLFFAGHGHTHTQVFPDRTTLKNGYLIPVEATREGGSRASWIRLDHWLNEVCQLPAHHILVILDACNSGVALGALVKYRGETGERSLEQQRARRSRRVITSALDDQRAHDSGPTTSHSLFTGCLIDGLTRDLVERRHVTGSELGLYLQQRVREQTASKQTPDFGALEHDDRGELVISLEPYLPRANADKPDPEARPEPDGPRQRAIDLDLRALRYHTGGEFARAEPLFRDALRMREHFLGTEHPEVAASLTNLATLYLARGAYAHAKPLLERVLRISEAAQGSAHPGVAAALAKLAALHEAQGVFAKAEPLYERALQVLEQAVGPAHPDVAAALAKLAALYQKQAEYAKAEPLYERALQIQEQAFGPAHPDVAIALASLAALYEEQGDYARAEPLYVRMLHLREQELGPDDLEVAAVLDRLAALYRAQGAYARAEPLYQRALQIRERVLESDHPDLATSLHDLAAVQQAQGRYAKAEQLYERALQIRERVLGSDHPMVASTLHDLAGLHRWRGANDSAARLYDRARRIGQQALGQHLPTARSHRELAATYQAQGDYSRAASFYETSLGIFEQALGAEHPEVARVLSDLAGLHRAEGAYDQARPLYERALQIWQNKLGPEHPEVATALNNLAWLFQVQAEYAGAEPLYERALQIRERSLGPAHPAVATSLNNLAVLCWSIGDIPRAAGYFERAAALQEHQLDATLAMLAEPRKRQLLQTQRGDTEAVVSFHLDAAPHDAGALALALTVTLRRKGRVLDEVTRAQATLRDNLSTELREALDTLQARRAELALRREELRDARHTEALHALEHDVERLERELNSQSAAFRGHAERPTIAAVQAALPADATLVEFVRYQRFDPRSVDRPWQEARYVAYVLQREGPPRFVALGEAAQIEAAVTAALAALSSPSREVREPLRALDELICAPIRRLGVTEHVLISPDAALHLVPFAALIDEDGHHLVDRWQTTYVTSGRDLARTVVEPPALSPPLVLAAPIGPWDELPGARGEAEALRGHFADADLHLGEAATKQVLLAARSPRFLHISTHGYWRGSRIGDAVSGEVAVAVVGQDVSVREPAPRASASRDDHDASAIPGLPPAPDDHAAPEDALEDSGFVLAAAELRDAKVTARELASVDLRGTRLAVLSACDTGIGQVTRSEGVYGLRRAITIAGARAHVVALWRIHDRETHQLMDGYYRELQHGRGRSEALRCAQRDMMRDSHYAHPFFWAAFVASGDEGPL